MALTRTVYAGASNAGWERKWESLHHEISFEAAVREYQRALLCVLPYTGSFAGRGRIAAAGRARAERDLSWDTIARETLVCYGKAFQFKQRSAAS